MANLICIGRNIRSEVELTYKNQKAAYFSGIVFVEAGLRCFEPVSIGLNKFNAPVPAGFVNLAFGCEVLFKALLQQEGKTQRGHALSHLLDALGDEGRRKVLEECSTYTGEDVETCKLGIASVSKVFEDLRYHWELLNDFQLDPRYLLGAAFGSIILYRSRSIETLIEPPDYVFLRLKAQSSAMATGNI